MAELDALPESELEVQLYKTLLWRECKSVMMESIAWNSTLTRVRRMELLRLLSDDWPHSTPRESEVAKLRMKILELEKKNAWLTMRNEELQK